MTKNINKKRFTNKRKKVQKKKNRTRKNKYGGDSNQDLREEQRQKNIFRRGFSNLIIQLSNKKNSKQGIISLIKLFNGNKMINTLIPITINGKPVDKETYNAKKTPIIDFVSPITVIFDNLTGIISTSDIIKILNVYYLNSGNFNNLSSRFKTSPFMNEVNKKRVDNIKILLDKKNNFHIIENGLDEITRNKLNELIPPIKEEPIIEQVNEKLQIPFLLPTNNDIGYDKMTVPDFWKPIFQNGEELLEIKQKFLGIYELDKYISESQSQKKIIICELVEKIIPGYMTKYNLDYRETIKTLINVNILNCFITLLYGMILYRLYDTKQDYLFMFKGGRALQLSLVDITNVGKYFSEDTDILIIPNKFVDNNNYDLLKMENLATHIAYLVKWIIPEEINIIVSLSTNPNNKNKDITKLLYNDGKLYKPVSDIGFGELPKDIKKYFDFLSYSPIYIDDFETNALFITPNLNDMLSEKLYYYAKYTKLREILIKKEQITDEKYYDLTEEICNFYIHKFQRAILKLVEAIIKKDYTEIEDYNRKDTSRLILRGFISTFNDYTNEEKENVVTTLYP